MRDVKILSNSSTPFKNRADAGKQLAEELVGYKAKKPVVLSIPRGGVIPGKYIADHLDSDFDVMLTHKLGAPGNPELAIGGVMENGRHFINKRVASYAMADENYIEREKKRQLQNLQLKVKLFRKYLPKLDLRDRIVIITDDGLATGATMKAGLWAAREEGASELVCAVPIAPDDAVDMVSEVADLTICLKVPLYFMSLSRFYLNFAQVEDEEVIEIIKEAEERRKSHIKE